MHVDVKSILNIPEPQSQPQPQTPQPLPDIATLMVFKIRYLRYHKLPDLLKLGWLNTIYFYWERKLK